MGRPRLVFDPEQEARRKVRRKASAKLREKYKKIFRPIIDEFLDTACVDCNIQYPRPAMQPDHVRGQKYQKICWFYGGNGTLKKLVEELEKCEVRCANCHAIRHAKEQK